MAAWGWIVLAVAVLIIVVLILGLRPLKFPRRVSEEGIEDNTVVQAYDKISRWPQFQALRWLVVQELKKHHPSGLLVDAGCGPGYLIVNIAMSTSHLTIIGVDISQEMINRATQNLSSQGLADRVSFRQGDIQSLPFAANSVDFLVSTLSMHHWSEPRQALQEIHRVLKPGGQFLLFDIRRDSKYLFYWLVRFAQRFVIPSVLRKANEPTSSLLAGYTSAELRTMLAKTPFQHYDVKPSIGWFFAWGQKG